MLVVDKQGYSVCEQLRILVLPERKLSGDAECRIFIEIMRAFLERFRKNHDLHLSEIVLERQESHLRIILRDLYLLAGNRTADSKCLTVGKAVVRALLRVIRESEQDIVYKRRSYLLDIFGIIEIYTNYSYSYCTK